MKQSGDHIDPKTNGATQPVGDASNSGVFFQAKLTVNQPGDPYEWEADALADRVMRMTIADNPSPLFFSVVMSSVQRMCADCEQEEKKVHRKAISNDLPMVDAGFDQYVSGLPGRGVALSDEERNFFEPRFGCDFSDVRLHMGPEAAQSAHRIQASAYTVGSDIVFNTGQYQPSSERGKQLMAHELTHVVQQQKVVMRQTIQHEPMDFPTRLHQVNDLLDDNRVDEAVALIPSLAAQMTAEQAMSEGIPLVVRLTRIGQFEASESILRGVERSWLLQYVLDPTLATRIAYPHMMLFGRPNNSPVALIETAERIAAEGDHNQARRLFASAYYLMQQLIIVRTESRDTEIAEMQDAYGIDATNQILSGFLRILFTQEYTQYYSYMRRILSFYPQRIRMAIIAGDSAAELSNTQLQEALLATIRDDFLLDGQASRSLVLETTIPNTDTGDHPVVQGVNGVTETITPLPGAPREDEVAQHPYYSIVMETLLDTFIGQDTFLTDLIRHPEIVDAFGGAEHIDMNNTEHRIQIWSLLYELWGGSADAFERVLDMVERYLQNYTVHTEYNIRDGGMPYFTSTMPTDMIGRTVRDCGVYAMMTAYEMYRMGARRLLDVRFRIIASLDHVVLVMFETGQNQHFVLSNNTINGPFPGAGNDDIISTVATNFGVVSNSRYAITPAAGVDLGDTDMSRRNFESRAWRRYQDVQNWGLRAQETVGPDGEIENQYEHHYREMRHYGNGAEQLRRLLNEMDEELAVSEVAEHLDIINAKMDTLMNAAIFLTGLFDRLGPNADVVTPSRRVQSLIGQRQYIFTTGNDGQLHPLSRLGVLLLRYQHLGGSINSLQQALLAWLRRVPMFDSDLNGFTP